MCCLVDYFSSAYAQASVIGPVAMGGQVSRDEFEWVYTQHPHVHRRKIILGELCPILSDVNNFDRRGIIVL